MWVSCIIHMFALWWTLLLPYSNTTVKGDLQALGLYHVWLQQKQTHLNIPPPPKPTHKIDKCCN